MSEIKLENRYLVIKLSDIESALDDRQKGILEGLSLLISSHRISSGKKQLNAVVIESDWPIYEQALELIKQQACQDLIREHAIPDWSKAPDGAKCWAVDSDGLACWFSLKPFPSCGRWCFDGYRVKDGFGYLIDRKITLPPRTIFHGWEETLHQRQEGGA